MNSSKAELDYNGHSHLFEETIDQKKTIVQLADGRIQIRDTATAIFQAIREDRTLFFRGGKIFELALDNNNKYYLEVVTPEMARTRFEKVCNFLAWRSGGDGKRVLKPSVLSTDTAKAIINCDANRILYPIYAVFNCAVLVNEENRTRIVNKGYDESKGILVTQGMDIKRIELSTAVSSLLALLEDFAFQSPSDKSRAIASLITPGLRMGGILDDCPLPIDVGEADRSQSGKTYRMKLIAAIYNEEQGIVTNRKGGVGSLDETLNEHLSKGRAFILFDNYRGKLDSQNLEALITAGKSFTIRIPHKGNIEIDPSYCFLSLTSNGVEFTKDLANRSSIVRIRKQDVDYKFKEMSNGLPLLEFVKHNQPFYLGCVFSVIDAYVKQGMPRTSERRHSFNIWAQTLDWIVQHLFEESPLLNNHEEAQLRVSAPALGFLRQLALVIEESHRLMQGLTSKNLFEICCEFSIEIAGMDANQYPNETVGGRKISSLFNPLFREKKTLYVEGFKVTQKTVLEKRADKNKGSRQVTGYFFTKNN